jgi:serine protease Do
MIEHVAPNSPAERAGLQELDVITELDGEKVTNVLELRKYLYNHKKVGDTMKVKYYRAGVENEATLKLTDETRM